MTKGEYAEPRVVHTWSFDGLSRPTEGRRLLSLPCPSSRHTSLGHGTDTLAWTLCHTYLTFHLEYQTSATLTDLEKSGRLLLQSKNKLQQCCYVVPGHESYLFTGTSKNGLQFCGMALCR